MAPQAPSDLPIHTFTSIAEMEAFFEREHSTAPGIWVQLAKKASGITSISASEAVEVALCYGWIDGRGKSHDDSSWLMRFTPRRPRSLWSKKNVATAQRLIREGRMRPAGLAQIDAAKADGRWARAYDGVTVPDDLAEALRAEPAAATALEAMPRGERYSALLRVQMASPGTREGRVAALVERLVQTSTGGSGKRKMEASGERSLRSRRRKG